VIPSGADRVTVLRSLNGSLAKSWRSDGTIAAYQSQTWFAVEERPVDGIDALSQLLFQLAEDQRRCVIRGQWRQDAPVPNQLSKTRRMNVCFEDAPRHFLALDVDKFEPTSADPVGDPEGAAREYVRAVLPPEFQEAAFHLQLSNSAGAPGKEHLLKAHIWFWLAKPATGAQLRAWQQRTGTDVDPSLFRQVQIHYTAGPLFEAGVSDPVAIRDMFVPGLPEVDLDLMADDLAVLPRPSKFDGSGTDGDKVSAWLEENWTVLGGDTKGHVWIQCPFEHEHSSPGGPSSTVYMPRGNGYWRGHFRCLHAHCDHRADADYLDALGLPSDMAGNASTHWSPVLDAKDSIGLARGLMGSRFQRGSHASLIRVDDTWYEYAGQCWQEAPDSEVRSAMWSFLEVSQKLNKQGLLEAFKPTLAQVTGAMDALRSVAGVKATPPCWLKGEKGPDPREIVSLTDGLLHIPTRELQPHSAGFFGLSALPYSWGEGEEPPREWLSFIEQVWPGDVEAQHALQEMFGYLLTADTSQQKMFLLRGPKRSGKGTIGRVLQALLGPQNVVSPTLTSLTSNFGLKPLIGKLVALVPDARVGRQSDKQAIVEKLLMLSGEDSVTVDRKHKEAWTGTLSARIVILTNEVPQLGDASGALAARFITISIRQSFYGREDTGLTERLLKELPGIFRWSLEGRERLKRRGHFLQPSSAEQDALDLKEANSSISVFADDMMEFAGDFSIPIADAFDAWRSWCGRSGRQNAGTIQTFGRSLRDAFPQVEVKRPNQSGNRDRVYLGIRLKPGAYEALTAL
jgi:P4 family phage/plasmid primase-like protien